MTVLPGHSTPHVTHMDLSHTSMHVAHDLGGHSAM